MAQILVSTPIPIVQREINNERAAFADGGLISINFEDTDKINVLKVELNQWTFPPLVILGYIEYYFIKECSIYVDQFPNINVIIIVEPSGDITIDFKSYEDNELLSKLFSKQIDYSKLKGSLEFCNLNQEYALPLLQSSISPSILSSINPCSTWIFPSHLELIKGLKHEIPYYLVQNKQPNIKVQNNIVFENSGMNDGNNQINSDTSNTSTATHGNSNGSGACNNDELFQLPLLNNVYFGPLQLKDVEIPVRQYCNKWGDDYQQTLERWKCWITYQATCGVWLIGKKGQEEKEGLFDDDRLIGWGLVYPWGAIGSLNIDEKHRGHGYGKAIIHYLVKKIRNRGMTPYSHVEGHNKVSAKVHEALGFVCLPNDVVWANL